MPRPTRKPTGALWSLLDDWRAAEAERSVVGHRPTQTEIARLLDVSDSLLGQWKYMEARVQTDQIRRISQVTGLDFAVVAEAAHRDLDAVVAHVESRRPGEAEAARDRRKPGSVDKVRAEQDRITESPDSEGPEFGA